MKENCKEIFVNSVLCKKIEQDIIDYFVNVRHYTDDDMAAIEDEILSQRSVLTIATIAFNNPLFNEKHLAEILDSFETIGDYNFTFDYLNIARGFCALYEDEVEECDSLTKEDANYILDKDGLKLYLFELKVSHN